MTDSLQILCEWIDAYIFFLKQYIIIILIPFPDSSQIFPTQVQVLPISDKQTKNTHRDRDSMYKTYTSSS